MLLLVIGAVTIVVVLTAYALYLKQQLRHKAAKEATDLKDVQEYIAQKKVEAWRSVQILSGARDDERITYTEIALRVRGLTQNMELNEAVRERMKPVFDLATATASLPIGDEWLSLTDKQKLKYKAQRMKAEARVIDALEPALEWLATLSYQEAITPVTH